MLFALLSKAAGKRISYLYFLILTLSISAFNLLTPWGSVLFTLGSFPVTRGALITGITKGVTISGLVFVSLFSVSRELVLPGRFGRLLGRSFYYFERLYSEKRRVRRKSFLSDIDEILLSLFPSAAAAEAPQGGGRTGLPGLVLILLTLGVSSFLSFSPWFNMPLF
jgi:heptaprenyl diphosphate synthase